MLVAMLPWIETKLPKYWNSNRPSSLCKPCQHVASQLLSVLLMVKLLLDQTSSSRHYISSCPFFWPPICLCCQWSLHAQPQVTYALLRALRWTCALQLCPVAVTVRRVSALFTVATITQPKFTAIALRLRFPSSLQSPECWCFFFDANIWPNSSQLICVWLHWFPTKSRSMSFVTVLAELLGYSPCAFHPAEMSALARHYPLTTHSHPHVRVLILSAKPSRMEALPQLLCYLSQMKLLFCFTCYF